MRNVENVVVVVEIVRRRKFIQRNRTSPESLGSCDLLFMLLFEVT